MLLSIARSMEGYGDMVIVYKLIGKNEGIIGQNILDVSFM